jgi:hypothetical protein
MATQAQIQKQEQRYEAAYNKVEALIADNARTTVIRAAMVAASSERTALMALKMRAA